VFGKIHEKGAISDDPHKEMSVFLRVLASTISEAKDLRRWNPAMSLRVQKASHTSSKTG